MRTFAGRLKTAFCAVSKGEMASKLGQQRGKLLKGGGEKRNANSWKLESKTKLKMCLQYNGLYPCMLCTNTVIILNFIYIYIYI